MAVLKLQPYQRDPSASGVLSAFEVADALLGEDSVQFDEGGFLAADAEYAWRKSELRWRIYLRPGISIKRAAFCVQACLRAIFDRTDGTMGPPLRNPLLSKVKNTERG